VCSVPQAHEQYGGGQVSRQVHGQQQAQEAPVDDSVSVDVLSTIFAGAITDNTSTNKKAWGLLQITFPSRYLQGCCSHVLHLFVKDVFVLTKTKKAGQVEATYSNQFPFELMLEFIAYCKDVVKYFHNHHVAKAHLQDL